MVLRWRAGYWGWRCDGTGKKRGFFPLVEFPCLAYPGP